MNHHRQPRGTTGLTVPPSAVSGAQVPSTHHLLDSMLLEPQLQTLFHWKEGMTRATRQSSQPPVEGIAPGANCMNMWSCPTVEMSVMPTAAAALGLPFRGTSAAAATRAPR